MVAMRTQNGNLTLLVVNVIDVEKPVSYTHLPHYAMKKPTPKWSVNTSSTAKNWTHVCMHQEISHGCDVTPEG